MKPVRRSLAISVFFISLLLANAPGMTMDPETFQIFRVQSPVRNAKVINGPITLPWGGIKMVRVSFRPQSENRVAPAPVGEKEMVEYLPPAFLASGLDVQVGDWVRLRLVELHDLYFEVPKNERDQWTQAFPVNPQRVFVVEKKIDPPVD